MQAAYSDEDNDIRSVEWFSSIANRRSDQVTGVGQSRVMLTALANAAFTWAMLKPVDGRGNSTSKKCLVEFESPEPPEETNSVVLHHNDEEEPAAVIVNFDDDDCPFLGAARTSTVPPGKKWTSIKFAAKRGDVVLLVDDDERPSRSDPPSLQCEGGYTQAFDADGEYDWGGDAKICRWRKDLLPGDTIRFAVLSYEGDLESYAITVDVESEEYGDDVEPDLVVQSPSVSDASPVPGQRFTLRATVRNRGTDDSDSTTLRYYLSTDSNITELDTHVGTDNVRRLSASRTDRESVSLSAPSSPGTYYYGACVDRVSGERNTGNNCSSGAAVVVNDAPDEPSPDLRIEYGKVTPTPVTTGGTVTIVSGLITNVGDADSPATTLRYYRSTHATFSISDTRLGTKSVPGLTAHGRGLSGLHDTGYLRTTAPSTPGTRYYGACVDTFSGEGNADNNCASGTAVTVQ